MKYLFFPLFFLACAPFIQAQVMQTFKLWTEDNDSEAEIFVYLPEASTALSPAILICPGGGYEHLAMNHEGHDMAQWYVSNEFAAVVLKYRMPNGEHAIPLSDAEKAISIIRSNASEWKIDPGKVGVAGSSAGGHLAASLSVLAADENRPDFAILYYPVICSDDSITHRGSIKNLLGENVNNRELLNRYSLEKQVDEKTPKTFLLLSDDDRAVLPVNSIRYYSALKEKEIPAAMYIFPSGGHGWGFNSSFLYHEEMKSLIQKWLKEIKIN
jgi:acetyl esterase/lipase